MTSNVEEVMWEDYHEKNFYIKVLRLAKEIHIFSTKWYLSKCRPPSAYEIQQIITREELSVLIEAIQQELLALRGAAVVDKFFKNLPQHVLNIVEHVKSVKRKRDELPMSEVESVLDWCLIDVLELFDKDDDGSYINSDAESEEEAFL